MERCTCKRRAGDEFHCPFHGGRGSLAHVSAIVPDVCEILEPLTIAYVIGCLKTVDNGGDVIKAMDAYLSWRAEAWNTVSRRGCHGRVREGLPGELCHRRATRKIVLNDGQWVYVCEEHLLGSELIL